MVPSELGLRGWERVLSLPASHVWVDESWSSHHKHQFAGPKCQMTVYCRLQGLKLKKEREGET